MKEVLHKIFKDNSFEMQSFECGDYYSSKVKSENYIVYFIDNLTNVNIDEILDNKIDSIAVENINKEMKKNTSVIFVTRTNGSELNNTEKKLIFKIEEDPYFYKKYVLWYTDEELKNINLYLDDMTKFLMNRELFQSMKNILEFDIAKIQSEEKNKVYSYMLLCRMFIKLPFLSLKSVYNKSDSNELQNFEKKIADILEKNIELVQEFDNDGTISDIQLSNEDIKIYLEKVEKDLKC
ncbi:hypothetical protein CHL78_005885 [Romboutsia weinsteinii]|uniref:Uncharacterized protein n=1 Tax=Romboutsia weinsteinii TaxID=2020949 RepID=A0A371J6Y5_9FIRM|nr:ABC-three component system middle component 1 [Romboutsia weinsteinii]RDY28427.1 hypothetical protein CHL78_005885 [Romboutsia weinsteinii]